MDDRGRGDDGAERGAADRTDDRAAVSGGYQPIHVRDSLRRASVVDLVWRPDSQPERDPHQLRRPHRQRRDHRAGGEIPIITLWAREYQFSYCLLRHR